MSNFSLNKLIPSVTRDQMAEVDRLMIEEYGINLLQMMENAGRSLALIAKKIIKKNQDSRAIAVLVGTGGNGGGGLVASRNLLNWGYKLTILVSKDFQKYKGIPKHQLEVLLKMKANVFEFEKFNYELEFDLIIDSILGYNILGKPRKTSKNMIEWANRIKDKFQTPILSLDLPSGIGPNGEVYNPAIKASSTLTLALPKTAMYDEKAKPYIGELYLADIGVPPQLYRNQPFLFDIDYLFNSNNIVKLY